MANTLLINKLTGGYFQFVLNGDTANAVRGIKNDLLAVGEQLHFKTGNGANIIKEQFIYPADLTIVASGTFTFTNVDQVWTKLIEIGYFDWINSGGSGTGASRFDDLLDTFKYTGRDGQAVIVNESQQKLQTFELYNYRTFTDLEDTPDLLLANKMVATNETGTALIFKNLPEDPVNYLNSIGFFDYNDLATQTVAISVTANTDTKLTNDTLGAYTNINYPPYGVSSLWDATTNRFNFSQLSIGDTIDVRIHLQVTTTTSNQAYRIGAKFGIGSASQFTNVIYSDQIKSTGQHEVSFVAPFYIGEANILNNPAELYINTDASASVKIDGWYIRVLRRNINIVNVETGVNDATTTVKGILRLAGDLAGNATNPTVPALADKALKTTTITINGTTHDLSANREWIVSADANWGGIGGVLSNQTDLQSALNSKEPNINAGSTSQYWRGDKSWQTLDKTVVGLGNVDNTSDTNKPISTATQTALNAKANDSAVVKLTGNQSISGIKTFVEEINSNADINLKQNGGIGIQSGYTSFGGYSDGLIFASSATKAGILSLSSLTTLRTYNLPDANGTLALTSQLPTISGPPNYLPKFTSGSALGNSLIYDNGTNVGIGTTSPVVKLDVSGDIRNINSDFLSYNSTNNTYSRYGFNSYYPSGGFNITNDGSFPLTFGTNATERIRITSGGNVGIGTTSPTQKLDVNGFINSTNGISVGGSGVSVVWTGTQAAYDAITTKSSTTIYFIQ